MNGFERKKEQKRQSILRVAIELFKTYGFKKASINDIAGKANVSQVTIYNYFGSKEELVREVVKAIILNLIERVREIMKEDRPFPEKLETIIFDKANIASQYRGELLQIMAQSDPETQQWIESLWRKDVNKVTLDLIEEGKRQGCINTHQSEKAIMLYFEILRKGAFASRELFANIEPDVELYRELNQLFVYGLVGKRE
ncbi:TetR/AcrR family transcriptional regulator [Chloroflexota bacterium]